MMADLQTLEKQREPRMNATQEEKTRWSAAQKITAAIQKGIPVREVALTEEEEHEAKQLTLLTSKPILVALNCDEGDLKNADEIEKKYATDFGINPDQVIAISARTEEQLAGFSSEDQKEYLKDLGIEKSGLERLIKKGFVTLNLMTFLTAGVKEVRAWTISEGTRAQDAAGVIHNDLVKKFIKADIVTFGDFVNFEGWKNCREKGKVRSEGRDYIMQEGDIVEFKIGS
jgi:hypothetical protein